MLRQVEHHIADLRQLALGCMKSPASVGRFVADSGIEQGLLTLFCRHTSASLVIQENAAPAARRDLEAYFERARSRRRRGTSMTTRGRTTCPRISGPR